MQAPDTYHVDQRFFGMLGLCRRAGKTVLGTELICTQMRAKSKPVLVFVSDEASGNTKAKLLHKSAYYGIPCYVIDADGARLAASLGKSGVLAAAAVTDRNFAAALRQACGIPD